MQGISLKVIILIVVVAAIFAWYMLYYRNLAENNFAKYFVAVLLEERCKGAKEEHSRAEVAMRERSIDPFPQSAPAEPNVESQNNSSGGAGARLTSASNGVLRALFSRDASVVPIHARGVANMFRGTLTDSAGNPHSVIKFNNDEISLAMSHETVTEHEPIPCAEITGRLEGLSNEFLRNVTQPADMSKAQLGLAAAIAELLKKQGHKLLNRACSGRKQVTRAEIKAVWQKGIVDLCERNGSVVRAANSIGPFLAFTMSTILG